MASFKQAVLFVSIEWLVKCFKCFPINSALSYSYKRPLMSILLIFACLTASFVKSTKTVGKIHLITYSVSAHQGKEGKSFICYLPLLTTVLRKIVWLFKCKNATLNWTSSLNECTPSGMPRWSANTLTSCYCSTHSIIYFAPFQRNDLEKIQTNTAFENYKFKMEKFKWV